ncbi:lasso peptide biosynthesis B2 protein [Pedobacter sp. MC2016-14]|uniref:lasso peptide biosynthesis B2 protein n=1 Tax=Pedobacter sp. MC2016-14 TaxID=2897327 RepID=UPI001E65322B|nr:lasso peptide biosynthesis B2 protein [Pedobacter sp. MC2016-14]MCD0486925.1 lasso peptide biosynthesis B2 protein [Pedobacter sp. MC2016-14]
MNSNFFKHFQSKFLSAPLRDKLTVVYIFFGSALLRFMIYFLPFRFYRNLLGKQQQEVRQELSANQIEQAKHLKMLIETVCNHTPWESKCLVQAILCKRLLNKRSIKSVLYLGIANNPNDSKLDAHAWVVVGELILTGAAGHKRFKPVNFYG